MYWPPGLKELIAPGEFISLFFFELPPANLDWRGLKFRLVSNRKNHQERDDKKLFTIIIYINEINELLV